MIRTSWLVVVVVTMAGLLVSTPTASAADLRGPCRVDLGPCLVFSRDETNSMADGNVTTVVAFLGPACSLTGPIFGPICGLALAEIGPGMQVLSKRARTQQRCSAVQFVGNPIMPSQSTAQPVDTDC